MNLGWDEQLTNLVLLDSHSGDLSDLVFGHGRRPSSIHLVKQLCYDGIQACPAKGIVARISVHEPFKRELRPWTNELLFRL